MVEREVVTPNLVRPTRCLRAWPRRSGYALPRPLARHLQPCRLPQPVRPAGAHAMAVAVEENADAPIAVPRILRRQLLHPRDHRRILRGLPAAILQRRSRHETACRPAAPRGHAPGHTPLAAGEPARSPFFCGDFLHHLNLEIALRHQLLQPPILHLELPQALELARTVPLPNSLSSVGSSFILATTALPSASLLSASIALDSA